MATPRAARRKPAGKSPVKAAGPVADPPTHGGVHSGEDRVDPPVDFPEQGPATPKAAKPARVTVTENTLIARADLGPNASTFVAAGHQIPLGLEDYPRTVA